MATKSTELTYKQYLRLIQLYDLIDKPTMIELVEVLDTPIRKIHIVYNDHDESIYPSEEDMDFILNGIKLERNEEK